MRTTGLPLILSHDEIAHISSGLFKTFCSHTWRMSWVGQKWYYHITITVPPIDFYTLVLFGRLPDNIYDLMRRGSIVLCHILIGVSGAILREQ
jgi:hypothetical protein